MRWLLIITLLASATSAQTVPCADPDDRPFLAHVDSKIPLRWCPASGPVEGYYVYRNGGEVPVAKIVGAETSLPDVCGQRCGKFTFAVAAYGADEEPGPLSQTSSEVRCGAYPDTDCGGSINATDFEEGFGCAFTGACRLVRRPAP